MNKFFKTTITILIVLPLSLSSILCCCLKEALAQTGGHSVSCHDHSHKANPGHNSQKAQECQCLKVLSNKTNNDFAIQTISSADYAGFLKDGKILGALFHNTVFNNTALIGDRPPPFLTAAPIPIYLKISIFRI